MFNRNFITDLKRHDYASELVLTIVTVLYSTSLTVSTSFQNTLMTNGLCELPVPFGECIIGEYDNQLEVEPNGFLKMMISFVVALLAGAWSDSHGRRRKPLILIPILGQIITDSLYFAHHFWYWPDYLSPLFKLYIPGLYVGRNMFWIGAMSYVSENTKAKSRTFKLGMLIATYTSSSLLGSAVVALLKIDILYYYRYTAFAVTVLFNLIAATIGYLFVKDTSVSYNKYIVWLRPKYLFRGFAALFKDKPGKSSAVLVALIVCQTVFVSRIGGDYVSIMRCIKKTFGENDIEYFQFSIARTTAIIFGILFSVIVLGKTKKINDLTIGLLICTVYIVAAVCYVVANQFWQIVMILIIYFCHGIAITIVSSLTSKLVEVEELGRLNSIQTSYNTMLTFVTVVVFEGIHQFGRDYYALPSYSKTIHTYSMIGLYAILTLPISYVFLTIYNKYKCLFDADDIPTGQCTAYVIS